MENKEQKIKMLTTALGNELKRRDDIIESIHKTEVELTRFNEESDRKHSELYDRYMKLCVALGGSKEYIENCQSQLSELTASDGNVAMKVSKDAVGDDWKKCLEDCKLA